MDTDHKARMFYSAFSEFINMQQRYFNFKLNPNGWKIIAHSLPVPPSHEVVQKKYYPITLMYYVSENNIIIREILKSMERFILNMEDPNKHPWKELPQERIDVLNQVTGRYIFCYYDNFVLDENSEEMRLDSIIGRS